MKISKSLYNFFEKKAKRESEIALGIINNNKILVTRKFFYPKGIYRIPAGGIDNKYETPEEAAKREAYEETGIRIKNPKQIAVIDYDFKWNNKIKRYRTYLFLVKVREKKIKPVDESEGLSGYKWISVKDLQKVSQKLKEMEKWKLWGKFRAISHDILYMILSLNL